MPFSEFLLFLVNNCSIGGRLGVSWVDMHLVANRVMLQHLKEYGLLQGDVDDMMKVCLKNCQIF